MIDIPTLARAALVAFAVAAIGQLATPVVALPFALVVGGVCHRRSPPIALAAIAVAVRSFLPDPPFAIDVPAIRERLALPVVSAIPEPDAGIAVGALLGGKSDLPRSVRDAFAQTGTTHLLAASGFNITLVAGALGAALRPAGRRAVACGTVLAAGVLTIAAGFAPSILRAALMSFAGSAAIIAGRPASAASALGAAVLVLLVASPAAVSDVGFLLSISATAGLLFLAAPIERRVPGPGWLRAQIAATSAATIASLPVSAEAFGRISLVSPFANLAAAPLIPPLMTATGVAIAGGLVAAPLAVVPAWCAFVLARALRAIVEVAAAVPGASVSLPHAGIGVLAVYGLAAILTRAPSLRRIAVVAVVIGGIVAGLAVFARTPSERIVALDVGQGDSFLLESGDARVLIDGGPEPPRTVRALSAALTPAVSRLDVIALTHSHADHEAGLIAVLDRYEVGLALEPAGLEMNPSAAEWRAAIARHGVALRAVTRGARIRVGSIELAILSPVDDPADPLPNLAIHARVGALTALFLGDASERGQEDLLLHPSELRADVYAPPHHGAATPYAEALVAAARPAVALVSVGVGNRYGHPTPQTLRALAHVPTLRTDRDGTLEVRRDGDSIRCATRATALPRPWDGWLSRPPPCT